MNLLLNRNQNGLWTLVPEDRPGATLEARKIDIINVHFECLPNGVIVIHDCTVKVNGVRWMAETGAVVEHARLQPLPRYIEVDVAKMEGSTS